QVESAKAAVELTSPVAGRIAETRVPVGGTARVGEVLVVIDTEAPPDAPATPPANASFEEGWFGIVGAPPRATTEAAPREARSENVVRAAPLVRKIARDRGIRLEDVAGSGPEGRIRLADLEDYAARAAPSDTAVAAPPVSAPAAEEERIPLQ